MGVYQRKTGKGQINVMTPGGTMTNEYRIHAYAQTEGLKVNTQVSDQIALKKAQMLDEALAHDFVIQLEAKLNTAYREVLSNHTQRLRSLYRESINPDRDAIEDLGF